MQIDLGVCRGHPLSGGWGMLYLPELKRGQTGWNGLGEVAGSTAV